MENLETIARKHFNSTAKEAADGSYEERRWMRNARTKEQFTAAEIFITSHFIPRIKGARAIMELGPGPGTWTRCIASAIPKAKIVLVDISKEMLTRASNAIAPHPTELREGDFLSVATEVGEVDAFFSSRAIEYVSDKRAAVAKIASVMTSNAYGCIITKMPKTTVNRIRRYTPSDLHQKQVYPKVLKQLLAEAELSSLQLYPVTMSVPFLRSAAADRLVNTFFSRFPLNPLSALFAESYAIIFRKP